VAIALGKSSKGRILKKIVVIGAGVIGVSTAYYLAREGFEVSVLESREGPALETSFANAGMISPSLISPWNRPGTFSALIKSIGREDSAFTLRLKALPSLVTWGISFLLNSNKEKFEKNRYRCVELASYSAKILKQLRDDLNIEYKQAFGGTLKIFHQQKSMDDFVDDLKYLNAFDINFQVLNGEEILQLEPSLSPIIDSLCGAVFFPADETGDAYEFSSELEKAANDLGVKFFYGETVKSFTKYRSNIKKVITNKSSHEAEYFVICAGSYSPVIAKKMGVNISVKPVKGYSVSSSFMGKRNLLKRTILVDKFHMAISPMENTVRATSSAEFVGFDNSLNREQIDKIYVNLKKLYPELSHEITSENSDEWCGFRPMTSNGLPYIGKTKVKNTFVNTGHGSFGWTLAVGSAKLLSDIICETKTAIDVKPYAVNK
jgi:D-amino-acid dehydrogenase